MAWLIPKMAGCGGDQCKSRQRKKAEAERKKSKHKESQRRWCWAVTCQTMATYGKPQSPWNWKTKVPASDKCYWLAPFSKYLCFLLSNFKLLTSSFTHHPRVTKVHAALHAHVRTLTQLATRGFWVNLHLVNAMKSIGAWHNRQCLSMEHQGTQGSRLFCQLVMDPESDD